MLDDFASGCAVDSWIEWGLKVAEASSSAQALVDGLVQALRHNGRESRGHVAGCLDAMWLSWYAFDIEGSMLSFITLQREPESIAYRLVYDNLRNDHRECGGLIHHNQGSAEMQVVAIIVMPLLTDSYQLCHTSAYYVILHYYINFSQPPSAITHGVLCTEGIVSRKQVWTQHVDTRRKQSIFTKQPMISIYHTSGLSTSTEPSRSSSTSALRTQAKLLRTGMTFGAGQ